MDDDLPSSPSAKRNCGPITEAIAQVLPPRGTVLEVASGTGEHAEALARAFPALHWQPSDREPDALAWIEARRIRSGLPNLLTPVPLDAASDDWPIDRADAVLCINMVHISPWEAARGLMRGAGRLLGKGSPLILYGPYRRRGAPTAPSNEDFDRSLRSRDPAWGLRDLEDVAAEAEAQGLGFERLVEMPANNLTVVFTRR